MVEYGNGVGQVAGQAGGSAGGGGITDLGGAIAQAIGQGVDTVASWPPEMLAVGAIAVVVFLIFLKRAF